MPATCPLPADVARCIRQAAIRDGALYAADIMDAYATGRIAERVDAVGDIVDEWGQCPALYPVEDAVACVIYDAWTDDSMAEAADLYVAFWAEGFADHVWCHADAWSDATGAPRV